MAETVIKKSNEAEKADELKLLANINKLDKQAEERDRKKLLNSFRDFVELNGLFFAAACDDVHVKTPRLR